MSEIKFGTTKNDEKARQDWLKTHKPLVYDKVIKYPEKIARGESIAIIQFQYDYRCNFKCEHCSIARFQMSHKEELQLNRRTFTHDDIRELSRQADEMGLAHFVINRPRHCQADRSSSKPLLPSATVSKRSGRSSHVQRKPVRVNPLPALKPSPVRRAPNISRVKVTPPRLNSGALPRPPRSSTRR